jgi:gliding motility associated protien GldN
MKNYFILFCLSISTFSIFSQDPPSPRGPNNFLKGGVVDGVVIKDETPLRDAIPYEHVRLADYVWSKRVFSRIDCREIMNHDLFFPYDYFEDDGISSLYKPKDASQIDDNSWFKDQKRWSLWTIIMRHILLGDLTVFEVSSELNPLIEDGYSLKYPIDIQSKNDYFNVGTYKNKINKLISSGGMGPKFTIARPISQDTLAIQRTNQTFKQFCDSLASDPDYEELVKGVPFQDGEAWWNSANVNGLVRKDAIARFISSNNIVAYNIKEDWFFDKERSILDRRIIAIAPVARFTLDDDSSTFLFERGAILSYSMQGIPMYFDNTTNEYLEYRGSVDEREMFWLYFPHLRNVIKNYYVYNDKSDAQWMSFDDLFWKRKFSAMIYKTSDKFDRDVEDYRFGVDALYEAEKIKEEIRKWEHDVWNF